ncbi:hypothetical protein OKJ48_05930 [Streptomyces kunmingensis]|uniref:Tetratricopeptide repeat protein n=1 Tax=Streptomyces kunmingensis TaxID=68225 RepID=A0ABU6C629_9ACTN|nr:hypothetical protein [Streptomyces kunmingensis]MEB3959790.1 hypothetical protein [Streptomyces kunmingensis]
MAAQREQAADDAMTTRIGQVVMLAHAGDREEARDRLLGLWAEIGEDGDPLHRCTLAHYLADTQDDPADELAWDLRALSAADGLTGERLAEHERPSAQPLALRALYPSLHLNLAADYVKLGRPGAARSQLARAWAVADALGDDGYGDGVRAALTRLEQQVAGLPGGNSGDFGEGPAEGPGGGLGEDGDEGGRPGGDPLGPPRRGA